MERDALVDQRLFHSEESCLKSNVRKEESNFIICRFERADTRKMFLRQINTICHELTVEIKLY